jgi:hypothetical protein
LTCSTHFSSPLPSYLYARRRLRRFSFFDLNSADKPPSHLLRWLASQTHTSPSCASSGSSGSSSGSGNGLGGNQLNNADIAEHTPFPLLLFSYSDLMELSDAIVTVLANRTDAVCVFAPHFCVGKPNPYTIVLVRFLELCITPLHHNHREFVSQALSPKKLYEALTHGAWPLPPRPCLAAAAVELRPIPVTYLPWPAHLQPTEPGRITR